MNLAPSDPSAVRLMGAIRSGAVDELARLLEEQPELANARIAGRDGGWRTPLHVEQQIEHRVAVLSAGKAHHYLVLRRDHPEIADRPAHFL